MPSGIYEHKKGTGGVKGKSGVYVRTEEIRKKMSEAKMGKHYPKLSEAMKGQKNALNCHHPLSEEARKKISETHKGNKNAWKGGSKEYQKRSKNKRRSFGFIPLNKPFKNADAHHLDQTYVIYIPEEIHQKIKHSVLKNINMDKINAIAFNYLGG